MKRKLRESYLKRTEMNSKNKLTESIQDFSELVWRTIFVFTLKMKCEAHTYVLDFMIHSHKEKVIPFKPDPKMVIEQK